MLLTFYYLFFYASVSNTYAYSKHLYLITNKTRDYFGNDVFFGYLDIPLNCFLQCLPPTIIV